MPRLTTNRRWQEQKNSAYKVTPRFVWAHEKTEALGALAIRMLKLNRVESAIACAKAISAIVENYGESEHAGVAGRADLFVSLRGWPARPQCKGLKESARRFRAMIVPSAKADQLGREEFEALMRRRNEELTAIQRFGKQTLPCRDARIWRKCCARS